MSAALYTLVADLWKGCDRAGLFLPELMSRGLWALDMLHKTLLFVLLLALTPGATHAAGAGPAVVSVLDIEANSSHRDEAEYWYGQIVTALDGLSGISARREQIPGASDLPHRDFERDLADVERAFAAARASLRDGTWMEAVRLSEEALTMAAKFDSPPLPGTLLRDIHILQSRALLRGERAETVVAAGYKFGATHQAVSTLLIGTTHYCTFCT